MSVADWGAPFRRVLGYEKMPDETGREMPGSNTITAEERLACMGRVGVRWA
jgi:hypothetical protein